MGRSRSCSPNSRYAGERCNDIKVGDLDLCLTCNLTVFDRLHETLINSLSHVAGLYTCQWLDCSQIFSRDSQNYFYRQSFNNARLRRHCVIAMALAVVPVPGLNGGTQAWQRPRTLLTQGPVQSRALSHRIDWTGEASHVMCGA